MIGFWTYVILVVPGIVLVLTISFVYWSRRDGERIAHMRAEAADVRRRAFDLSTHSHVGQGTATFGTPEMGSEAYQRAASRAQAPSY